MAKVPKRTEDERKIEGSTKMRPAIDSEYKYNKRFLDMKKEGVKWHPTLKELSLFCNPTRGSFDNNTPNNGAKIDHRKQIDGHARRAVRTLASGMTSGLTSPSRPWFALSVEDPIHAEIPNVKIWLTDSRDRMLDVFSRSNTYGALHTIYEEIGTFATACMLVEEDVKDVIRCRSYTAGEYYLAIGKDGRTNGFCREYSMTVDQMVRDFGYDDCSDSVKSDYDNDQLDKWVKVRHLIELNDKRQPDRADNKNMMYRSIHWEEACSETEYLRWSGYED
ncbi:MAG: portal protein, partial [Flavobacteriales bacterium]